MLPIIQTLEDLPTPSAEALAHSARLRARIREEIGRAGGRIPFARFMELALYTPGLGYYSAGARKFGAAGDFITAPELSLLFSVCLARQCKQVLEAFDGGDILELGAGSGIMAADILAELEHTGCLPQAYLILEVSGELRARQRQTLAQRVPQLLSRVRWLEELPASFSGIVLGNEVLDALPVARFRKTVTGFEEFAVATDGEDFRWETVPASASLASALQRMETTLPAPLAAGYVSEFCPTLVPLITSLAGVLKRGATLFTDYGYPRAAYYHADRSMGTLMCHYRQRAHADPFLYIGLQDITAFVDFTAVAEAGTAAGLSLAGYTTQAHFLLALGLADAADADMRAAQQIKLLTLPEEMGERFKAIGFSKGLELELQGFRLRDLSHQL